MTAQQPRRWDRVRARSSRLSGVLRPAALMLLATLLLLACYRLFLTAEPDSFARELVSAAMGAVTTVGIAGIAAAIALRDVLHRRRERAQIRRFSRESWRTHHIQVGDMVIPEMSVEVSCGHGVPWTRRATYEFTSRSDPRPVAPLVQRHQAAWWAQATEEAAAANRVLTDGPRVDLADVRVSWAESGERLTHYDFVDAPASYREFACTTARLDRKFQDEDEDESEWLSLRERWAVSPTGIPDVSSLPAPAVIGSGTVVVSSDERLVLSVRTARAFVASGSSQSDARVRVHVVAEGLLPTDRDRHGRFSPRAGAERALREELHVGRASDHLAGVNELIDTGLCFDQNRWQPYFTFLARLDRPAAELETGMAAATDRWEHDRLISLPFDIEHEGVRQLMLDSHPDLELASNHAKVSLWFALLYHHGYRHLRDALTLDSSRAR